LDIFAGDQMLFNRSDELESSWGFITKILQGWERENKKSFKISQYEKGSWGPKEAFDLIEKDNRKWIEA
jgi:glucose-6-phosphate 1-dehydrogenase